MQAKEPAPRIWACHHRDQPIFIVLMRQTEGHGRQPSRCYPRNSPGSGVRVQRLQRPNKRGGQDRSAVFTDHRAGLVFIMGPLVGQGLIQAEFCACSYFRQEPASRLAYVAHPRLLALTFPVEDSRAGVSYLTGPPGGSGCGLNPALTPVFTFIVFRLLSVFCRASSALNLESEKRREILKNTAEVCDTSWRDRPILDLLI